MDSNEDTNTILDESSEVNRFENIDEELEKTDNLIDNMTDSFHVLTKALEVEQAKLLELEQRRRKIQEQMHNLKIEITEEKALFEEDMETVANAHITEASLPDPVDVFNFNIELKSEFMKEFLNSKRDELQNILNPAANKLSDIEEEEEGHMEGLSAKELNSIDEKTTEAMKEAI